MPKKQIRTAEGHIIGGEPLKYLGLFQRACYFSVDNVNNACWLNQNQRKNLFKAETSLKISLTVLAAPFVLVAKFIFDLAVIIKNLFLFTIALFYNPRENLPEMSKSIEANLFNLIFDVANIALAAVSLITRTLLSILSLGVNIIPRDKTADEGISAQVYDGFDFN